MAMKSNERVDEKKHTRFGKMVMVHRRRCRRLAVAAAAGQRSNYYWLQQDWLKLGELPTYQPTKQLAGSAPLFVVAELHLGPRLWWRRRRPAGY